MGIDKPANPSYNIFCEAKDCYQWQWCSLFVEVKFIFLVALVFIMLPHSGKLLSQDIKLGKFSFLFMMLNMFKCINIFFCAFVIFMIVAAYDPLDPNGNITIKWDVVSWTADGYVVSII